jgi:hypothetical protein
VSPHPGGSTLQCRQQLFFVWTKLPPFSTITQHLLCHHLYEWWMWSDFQWENMFHPQVTSHTTVSKLQLSLPLHINLSPVQHLSELALMPSSVCYPSTNATSCPQNKMQTEVADWGISLVEHASYIAQCTSIGLILEWFRPGMVPNVVDYSCSEMKWSVKLKTKTTVLLYLYVCVL